MNIWKFNDLDILKTLVVILLLLVLSLGYTIFNSTFFGPGSFRIITPIGEKLQANIDSTVARHNNMVAIQVVKVDLQKNIRYIAYTSIKDPVVEELYNTFVTNKISREVPVFTGKEHQDNILISIINHEFICYPFKSTISYELVPEIGKYVSTVCATTIPPQSGKFSGFIAVFLKNDPNSDERDIIRIESLRLSSDAYNSIK